MPWSEVDERIKNPVVQISPEQQALYHAQCVMAANMTHLLWINFEHELKKLGFQHRHLELYLERISLNYIELGPRALTGPLVRNDQSTIANNLKALEGDPFHHVYAAFVSAYQEKILSLRNT